MVETIKVVGDNVHVNANGVISAAFARPCKGGGWAIFVPQIASTADTLNDALVLISEGMDTWYTAAQAAKRLVEMGVFDKPPTAKKICGWARDGLLPGAIKVSAPGQGGSWRIPGKALAALAERRG